MARLSSKLTILSVLFLIISAWAFQAYAYHASTITSNYYRLIWVSLGIVALCLSLLCLWILSCRTSPYHGLRTLLLHIIGDIRSSVRGKHLLKELRKSWKDPRKYQEQYLLRIIRENGDTEYGKRFQLKEVKSRDDFRKRHPLITYETYKPYVERTMAGERGVLTRSFLRNYCKTSGTTGPSKYFGHTDREGLYRNMLDYDYAIADELCPNLGRLQKRFLHYIAPDISTAKSGASIETALTLGKNWNMHSYTAPPVGFRIQSFNDANYVHLLFGVREPNLGVFFCLAVNIDTLMKQLERWWEDIVADIEHGTINEKVDLPPDVRDSLTRSLQGGDRERAEDLRREFEKGFGGIMKRVWPHIAVIMSIDSAGLWPQIEEKYAKGIPFLTFSYGCSEGLSIGVPLWLREDRTSLVFDTNNLFLEFIKFENSQEDQPETYFVDELVVNQVYEVVISQASGLYRYRLGDIVRVTGFHDKCPTFENMFRLGLVLNVRHEKMDQRSVKDGLHAAIAQRSGVKLTKYTVGESTLIPETSAIFEGDEIMPYYLVFLELEFEAGQSEETRSPRSYTSLIDAEFRKRNSDYESLRGDGSISQPRVHILTPGSFDDLKDFVLATTNTSANQYKVPRKIRTVEMLDFLLDHRVI